MRCILILILLIICCTAKSQKDYIIQNNGMKIYGEIKGSNPASYSGQISFKTKNSITKILYPGGIKGWKRGNKVYETKKYRISKKKSYTVFMECKTGEGGRVKLYEFYNSYGEFGYIQTFLERDDKLTEVQFIRFRNQMKQYFEDEEEIVQLIQSGKIKKKDLLNLVTSYNQVKEGRKEVEKDINLQSDTIQANKIREEEEDYNFWDIDDMLLSMESAEEKYLSLVQNETKDIRDKNLREIIINHKIGKTFFDQQQYERSLPYLRKALKTIKRSHLKTDLRAATETMLGSVFTDQRKYDQAIIYNSEALSKWKNGFPEKTEKELVFKSYLNQGYLLRKINSATETEAWYIKSVKSEQSDWKKTTEQEKGTLLTHANNPGKSDDYNMALIIYENAEALLKKHRGSSNQHIDLQLAIGSLYFEAGDYNQSKEHYKAALDRMEKEFGGKHPKMSETTGKLSEIYLAAELYTEALAYIEQAQNANTKEDIVIDRTLMSNINKVDFPFELLNSITTKAIIQYRQLGEFATEETLKKILAHYSISTELLHQLRNTYRNEGSQYRLANVTHRFSQHAIIICNRLFELTKKEIYLSEAFHYAELSKSAVLFETIHDLKSKEVSGIPKEEIILENGLKSQIAYLKGEIFYEMQNFGGKNASRVRKIEAQIGKITEKHNQLLHKFESKYPQYYELKYNYSSIKLKDLQEELSEDEVFLEYVATDTFIYLLAISKQQVISQFTKLKESLPISIKRMQYILKNNKADLFELHGHQLYKTVIGKISKFIKGKKLIIASDAELNYIPFGILPTGETDHKTKFTKKYGKLHYLIEDHAICYNYSAGIYVHSKQKRQNKATKKIATWAPNFESMNKIISAKGIAKNLSELPGAQHEAQEIAGMFKSKAYINEEATEKIFKETAKEYSVLHIATHGILSDSDPLYSNLILCNQDGEDGILHAFELYNMQLNADLAVLSACNSGMGQLTKGEGVVSIARGFSYAGVTNIIMSKWPVSDWSTQVLMKAFYRNLRSGQTKDIALQQAKIKYLEQNRDKEKLIAPFFWGGFVLSGNSSPVEILIISEINNYLIYGGITLLVLLFIIIFLYRKKRS